MLATHLVCVAPSIGHCVGFTTAGDRSILRVRQCVFYASAAAGAGSCRAPGSSRGEQGCVYSHMYNRPSCFLFRPLPCGNCLCPVAMGFHPRGAMHIHASPLSGRKLAVQSKIQKSNRQTSACQKKKKKRKGRTLEGRA